MVKKIHSNYPISRLLHTARGWMSQRRAARHSAREREAAITEAIEAVIAGTEPKLRALNGYEKRLAPAVERTLDYIDDLIEQLPPPIELSRESWQRHPHINAFFATVTDLPLFLSRVEALRDFFERRPHATQAYAILTSIRDEKRVFGISLEGGMVRRDVAQTSVGFREPRILSPTPTEEELRKEAKRCALKVYIGLVRKNLANSQDQRASLERERLILETQRRSLLDQKLKHGSSFDTQVKIGSVEKKLAGNAAALKVLGGPRPNLEAMFEQVRDLLATPEQQINLAPAAFSVDRFGIKQEKEASEIMANELSLLECTTPSTRKVITLVRCPRSEMSLVDQVVARMDAYLVSHLGLSRA